MYLFLYVILILSPISWRFLIYLTSNKVNFACQCSTTGKNPSILQDGVSPLDFTLIADVAWAIVSWCPPSICRKIFGYVCLLGLITLRYWLLFHLLHLLQLRNVLMKMGRDWIASFIFSVLWLHIKRHRKKIVIFQTCQSNLPHILTTSDLSAILMIVCRKCTFLKIWECSIEDCKVLQTMRERGI